MEIRMNWYTYQQKIASMSICTSQKQNLHNPSWKRVFVYIIVLLSFIFCLYEYFLNDIFKDLFRKAIVNLIYCNLVFKSVPLTVCFPYPLLRQNFAIRTFVPASNSATHGFGCNLSRLFWFWPLLSCGEIRLYWLWHY